MPIFHHDVFFIPKNTETMAVERGIYFITRERQKCFINVNSTAGIDRKMVNK